MSRPKTYRRAGKWLDDLRRLHRNGHSDAAIAVELSLLFAPDSFSKRQVRHWRQQLGLKARRQRHQGRTLTALRQARARRFQTAEGWGHLLGDYVEADRARKGGQKGHWTDGVELRPVEVKILSLLRDRGPLTRRMIAAALGSRSVSRCLLRNSNQGWLVRLVKAGLLARTGMEISERCRPLYDLTKKTREQIPAGTWRRPTGIEQRFGINSVA